MVGETWDNWKQCVAKTLALSPDSVTIYQMELPYNTTFSQQLKVIGRTNLPRRRRGRLADQTALGRIRL